MKIDDLVSVVLITYNHENFIERAIDSIICQKSSFKIELLIAEDCSTDNTRQIVMDYADRYPKIIRALLREKNLGPTKNLYDAYQKCSGKYIAQLEGDDYWTDPEKLQKQYDFLEKNKEYICVTHRHTDIDRDGEIFFGTWNGKSGKHTLEDFVQGNIMIGHFGTYFYRNIFIEDKEKYKIIYKAHDYMGDVTLSLILLLQGPVYCMNEKMSVYRNMDIKGGSNWRSVNTERDMEYESIVYSSKLLQWVKQFYGLTDIGIDYMHKNIYLSVAYLKDHPGRKGIKLLKRVYMQDDKKRDIIRFFISMRKKKLKSSKGEGYERS